jgi:CDP-diacylglycerol---glycerol-3-phosphate 3-phosphatidyltransferase
MTSIYLLKPRFQALLRPLVGYLASKGVTANSITLLAMLISCGMGAFLLAKGEHSMFLLLPVWMFLRMAFNAVDGMLAREYGQQTRLGAYLNELSDVVSDAALYVPFVAVFPFGWGSVGAVIFLAGLSEMSGVLGPMIGARRGYEGPMGKSDRAFVFGSLGLWLGLAGALPEWAFWVMPTMAALIALNIVNRIRCGLQQTA